MTSEIAIPQTQMTKSEASGYDRDPTSLIDLAALLGLLYRNRWLVGAVILASLLLSVIATALSTPRYAAETSLQVDPQPASVLEVQDSGSELRSQDSFEFLQTQLEIVKSRSIAAAVAEDLGLLKDNSFLELMGHEVPDADLQPNMIAAQRRESVITVLRENQTAKILPSSQIIVVGFTGPNPKLTAQIVNSYAESYVKDGLDRRFNNNKYAREFISEQLALAKQKLEQSELELNNYARQAGLVTLGESGESIVKAATGTLTALSLGQTNAALSAAKAERVEAEQLWQAYRSASPLSIPIVFQNSAVSALLQKKSDLQSKYAEGSQRWGPEYPAMLQLAAEMKDVERNLNSLANGIKSSIRAQYQAALGKEVALRQEVSRISSDQLNDLDNSVRFGILSREVTTNRTLYDGLLQRFKELSASTGLSGNNISVIDIAVPSREPVSPKPVLNVLIGLLLGVFAAAVLLFVKERLLSKVRDANDVAEATSQPVLGVIPNTEIKDFISEFEDSKSNLSESYQSLIATLRLSTAHGIPSSFMMGSGRPSEGKTTSALWVAGTLARMGRKTLLIDADLRRPAIHTRLKLSNEGGLAEVLTGAQESNAVIRQIPELKGLHVMTSGGRPPRPPELLGSDEFSKFLDEVVAQFDHVIIDAPPLLGLADALLIASKVDGCILVSESGVWSKSRLLSMIRRLKFGGNDLLGIVITKHVPEKTGMGEYNYDYQYDY